MYAHNPMCWCVGKRFQTPKVDSKPPRLKAKAAETRNMVPVICFTLPNFFPGVTEHEKLRLQCMNLLNAMYEEMLAWGPTSPAKLAKLGRQHGLLYAELGLPHADNIELCFWRMYPKHHLMIHLVESGDNPRACWCYADEGEIGVAVKIAQSVHVLTLGKALLDKYRLM